MTDFDYDQLELSSDKKQQYEQLGYEQFQDLDHNFNPQQADNQVKNQIDLLTNEVQIQTDYQTNGHSSKIKHFQANSNCLSNQEKVKLKMKKFNNQVSDYKAPLPRYSEIQQSIQTLKSITPELFNDKFVDLIYSSVFERLIQRTGISHSNLSQFKKETALNKSSVQPLDHELSQNYKKQNWTQQLNQNNEYDEQQNQNFYDQKQKNLIDEKERKTQNHKKKINMSRYQQRKQANNKERYLTQLELVRKLNKVWNHRYEAELIRAYKECRSLADIRDHFQESFPQDKQSFSSQALRSKICKILRVSIRRLYNFVAKFSNKRLPQIRRINQNSVRGIIYNNSGLEVRILLLDVYMERNYNERLIAETIKAISNYVSQIEQRFKLNKLLQQSYSQKKNESSNTAQLEYYRKQQVRR